MESRKGSIGQWAIEALQSALADLAAPAAEQEVILRRLGDPEAVDELALAFDDANQMVPQLRERGLLTDAAVRILLELDGLLLAMSGPSGPWSVTDLPKSEQWASVRALARSAGELIAASTALRAG